MYIFLDFIPIIFVLNLSFAFVIKRSNNNVINNSTSEPETHFIEISLNNVVASKV